MSETCPWEAVDRGRTHLAGGFANEANCRNASVPKLLDVAHIDTGRLMRGASASQRGLGPSKRAGTILYLKLVYAGKLKRPFIKRRLAMNVLFVRVRVKLLHPEHTRAHTS